MVLNAIFDLLFVDEDSLGANPGSPPYLGSISSSQDARSGCCYGGCFSSLLIIPSLFRSDQQQYQKLVESLGQRCDEQELELQRSTEKIQEAMALITEEAAKTRAVEEVVKSLTTKIESLGQRCDEQELELQRSTEKIQEAMALITKEAAKTRAVKVAVTSLTIKVLLPINFFIPHLEDMAERLPRDAFVANQQNLDHPTFWDMLPDTSNGGEAPWVGMYEPGVYVYLVNLQDGTRDLTLLRFSREIFDQHRAETWFYENYGRLCEHYNIGRPYAGIWYRV